MEYCFCLYRCGDGFALLLLASGESGCSRLVFFCFGVLGNRNGFVFFFRLFREFRSVFGECRIWIIGLLLEFFWFFFRIVVRCRRLESRKFFS